MTGLSQRYYYDDDLLTDLQVRRSIWSRGSGSSGSRGSKGQGQDLDLDLICISTIYEDISLDLRQI